MIKIFSFQLVIAVFSIALFRPIKGHDAIRRLTEVFSSSSAEEYEYNNKSVSAQSNQSIEFEKLNTLISDTEYDGNESNIYDINPKVNVNKRETLHDIRLSRSALVVGRSDEKLKKVFDEKAREDGFKKTAPKDFPYAVLLVPKSTGGDIVAVCSGSLIARRWVLTVAHCFKRSYRDVVVYAGGNSLDEIETKTLAKGSQLKISRKVYTHPDYNPKVFEAYDVALVEVNDDFNLTDTVNTVALSPKPWSQREYRECHFTGFGRVGLRQDNALDYSRKTHLWRVSSTCNCLRHYGHKLRRLLLCSEPREDFGACTGDSGGGLICGGSLAAVAKMTVAYKDVDKCSINNLVSVTECGLRNTLTICQQICPYRKWISSYVKPVVYSSIDKECNDFKFELISEQGNFDTIIQTSNILILMCSLGLLFFQKWY